MKAQKLVPVMPPVFWNHLHSLAHGPFLQSQQNTICFSLSDIDLPTSKNPCDYIILAPSPRITVTSKIGPKIPSAKSLSPGRARRSKVPGLKTWASPGNTELPLWTHSILLTLGHISSTSSWCRWDISNSPDPPDLTQVVIKTSHFTGGNNKPMDRIS